MQSLSENLTPCGWELTQNHQNQDRVDPWLIAKLDLTTAELDLTTAELDLILAEVDLIMAEDVRYCWTQ